MGRIIYVYVSGPYTLGDMALNTRNAIAMADLLRSKGFVPVIPHLVHFWHMLFPHEYEYWLNYDLMLLKRCDAIIRLPGHSNGADIEVQQATEWGIPVFFNVDDIVKINEAVLVA